MSDKISIIVPIYNVEKYLVRCIDSIIKQKYSNFELILVDDGSTDNSGKICDNYQKRDDRITVIHKSNGGLSSARNAGLEIASGEYIVFIDSDDYVLSEYLDRLISIKSVTNADVVMCGYQTISSQDKPKPIEKKAALNYRILEKKEVVKSIYSSIPYEGLVTIVAWNKLYKASIFANLRYPNNKTSEDNFIVLDWIEKCSLIAFCTDQLYCYRYSDNSITRSKYSEKNFDLLDALEERNEKLLPYGQEFVAMNTNYFIKQIYIDYYRTDRKDLKKLLKDRFKSVYKRSCAEGYIYKEISKIKYDIFMISPKISWWFVKIIGLIR